MGVLEALIAEPPRPELLEADMAVSDGPGSSSKVLKADGASFDFFDTSRFLSSAAGWLLKSSSVLQSPLLLLALPVEIGNTRRTLSRMLPSIMRLTRPGYNSFLSLLSRARCDLKRPRMDVVSALNASDH